MLVSLRRKYNIEKNILIFYALVYFNLSMNMNSEQNVVSFQDNN